ncbi:hypothetical protein [Wolbachia endosymbiont of Pentidionis agamae]|uniref:hypothetical protein n=1 Tax=Wolbachia endosymbiont of Pentidionis agamae TaxID=3110435 RepID=UPI002FD586CC
MFNHFQEQSRESNVRLNERIQRITEELSQDLRNVEENLNREIGRIGREVLSRNPTAQSISTNLTDSTTEQLNNQDRRRTDNGCNIQ